MFKSGITVPIAAGMLVASTTGALADGAYLSWCIDYDLTKVREVAATYSDSGCSVTTQKPYEGSEEKTNVYSGATFADCYSHAKSITNEMEDFNCGGWSWVGDADRSYLALMVATMDAIKAYMDVVNTWNETSHRYTDFSLREIALVFPSQSRTDIWSSPTTEIDPSDLDIMGTFGRYKEGFNWPDVFVKAMRADAYTTYNEDEPTKDDKTVLEFGQVEDGACHGNDGKHLTSVDYDNVIKVHLLAGYGGCDDRFNREVLGEEKYIFDHLGEGIMEFSKVE